MVVGVRGRRTRLEERLISEGFEKWIVHRGYPKNQYLVVDGIYLLRRQRQHAPDFFVGGLLEDGNRIFYLDENNFIKMALKTRDWRTADIYRLPKQWTVRTPVLKDLLEAFPEGRVYRRGDEVRVVPPKAKTGTVKVELPIEIYKELGAIAGAKRWDLGSATINGLAKKILLDWLREKGVSVDPEIQPQQLQAVHPDDAGPARRSRPWDATLLRTPREDAQTLVRLIPANRPSRPPESEQISMD